MLTRLRFEAMGSDPGECAQDCFAAVHALLGEPGVAVPSAAYAHLVVDEHYERMSSVERVEDLGQVYRGRVVLALPINPGDALVALPDEAGMPNRLGRRPAVPATVGEEP